jgi:hypothetical protein
MNANNNVVNDAFVSVAENMKAKDAAVRLLLTAALVGVILAAQPIQYLGLIVLVLAYLFTTAITRWDPFYLFFGRQLKENQVSNLAGLSEGSVSTGIDQYSSASVANDSRSPDDQLKHAG